MGNGTGHTCGLTAVELAGCPPTKVQPHLRPLLSCIRRKSTPPSPPTKAVFALNERKFVLKYFLTGTKHKWMKLTDPREGYGGRKRVSGAASWPCPCGGRRYRPPKYPLSPHPHHQPFAWYPLQA
eukprot:6490815-Amphidinium_carterae.4